MYNPTKTGIDSKQLLEDIGNTIKFWTEYVHKTYFKRNCKVKPLHIFQFLLHMAECRSESAKSILSNMYAEYELRY